MSNTPPRKTLRTAHLDASIVHVEHALIARAEKLENFVREETASGDTAVNITRITAADLVAAEFRLLAEELHWW